ncbi:Fatty acid desaturase [seawater metagenome]|uniref:Fatty acid desaturase n=1 Tax=seawater metagenome TaxID=1561972 RepID=A0A5E8CLE0_9ZZZZ
MVKKLYSRNEIEEIKKGIEPYKNFYLESNRKPTYILITTIIGYLISIHLCKISIWYIPFFCGFTSRLFMIFHDCCHNSFFKVTEKEHNRGFRGYNKIVANILEPMVFYNEKDWRIGHGNHHKVHGNKSEVDGTKTVITLKKFKSLPFLKKYFYRFFRSPIIFFSILPLYIFWFNHILKPIHVVRRIIFFYLIHRYGKKRLVKSVFIGQIITGIYGVMIFHLQHQVNTGYWKEFETRDKLSYDRAQLHGASMLQVPIFLKWITFGIEYHHIHHLTPRIPSYNLQKCHEDNEHLFNKITKVGYKQAFKSLFHTLYDENEQRYVSFWIDRCLGLQA